MAWLVLTGLLALVHCASLVLIVLGASNASPPNMIVQFGGVALDFFALGGLWGYAMRRRVLVRGAWITCAALVTLQFTVPAANLVVFLSQPLPSAARLSAIMGLSALAALRVPLVFGLCRYAFASPEIWSPARAARG
jgi:hypothetical protein